MDENILKETMELSLAGKITFPAVVKKLISNNTERYTADLVAMKKFYYGNSGEIYESTFKLDAPKITLEFDVKEIKNAIQDIQQLKIDYQTFLKRIMSAGCTHYQVFINGKKAIYFGRDGSHHIELFPLAK